MPPPNPKLESVLRDFQSQVNANPHLKGILKGWSPSIVLEPNDHQARFTIRVADGRVAEVLDFEKAAEHTIRLGGEGAILERVFSGEENPAAAVLEGSLTVFASEKDQVKLDAVSLILWGV